MPTIDILIPTYNRPDALAITLTSLCGQSSQDFRVTISDQTEGQNMIDLGSIQAVLRVLKAHGNSPQSLKHLPRQGIAEQRQFLLEQASAPYVLFLDDDVLMEPWVLELLLNTIQQEKCGFVGNPLIGSNQFTKIQVRFAYHPILMSPPRAA
jgi:GT2 family glycosyltransferase